MEGSIDLPEPCTPSTGRNPPTHPHSIAAPSLTAKHYRDATEAEPQTGPPPRCNPSCPTGTYSCLSPLLHFFPPYLLHLIAALQPPCLSSTLFFLFFFFVFFLILTAPVIPDAACLASPADVEAACLALALPPSVLLEFHSSLDCFFPFFY